MSYRTPVTLPRNYTPKLRAGESIQDGQDRALAILEKMPVVPFDDHDFTEKQILERMADDANFTAADIEAVVTSARETLADVRTAKQPDDVQPFNF